MCRTKRSAAADKEDQRKKAKEEIEIFVKAGPEGTDIGDCPFAQYNRMVLAVKGISYTTTPCTAETKPDWLVKLLPSPSNCHHEKKEPVLSRPE